MEAEKKRDFNSIKVRLEPSVVPMLTMVVNDFNSIKVRLELSPVACKLNQSLYFNSIKVRLELMFTEASSKGLREFQFHKGAIRTKSHKFR
mgnify:CR=1 FL=1